MSEHNIQFCLFSDLEQLAALFLATYIVFIESLIFKQLLNLKRMASKNVSLVFVT